MIFPIKKATELRRPNNVLRSKYCVGNFSCFSQIWKFSLI